MNRRDLIKPLAALVATPVFAKGKDVGRSYNVTEGKFIVVINARQIDPNDFIESCTVLPEGTPIYSVCPTEGFGMDDMIRIFRLDTDTPIDYDESH